jgi:hypothetical protein
MGTVQVHAPVPEQGSRLALRHAKPAQHDVPPAVHV